MFRLANYQVTVYGGNRDSDGASHKRMNMRHLSATETTAKPPHNDYLLPGNQYLAIECNRAGIELFEKFLADNPSLEQFARARVVRAYRETTSEVDAAIREQREIESRPWPSGKPGGELREISPQQLHALCGIHGVGRAIEVSGYDVEFVHLMDEIEVLLQCSGVQFQAQHLSRVRIAELSKEHFVVSAMGVEEPEVIAIIGWFFKLPAVGNEGAEMRGSSFRYDLPIGVMNCRLDGHCILVSGGQVPPRFGAGAQRADPGSLSGRCFSSLSNVLLQCNRKWRLAYCRMCQARHLRWTFDRLSGCPSSDRRLEAPMPEAQPKDWYGPPWSRKSSRQTKTCQLDDKKTGATSDVAPVEEKPLLIL